MEVFRNRSEDFTLTFSKTESVGDLMKVALFLHRVLLPGIVLFGLIGNILSLLVFNTTKLRRLSSSVYLSALALSDSGFLLCVLLLWINTLNVSIFHRPILCQSLVYLTFIFSFLSVWIVNVLTLELYVITFYLSTRTLQLLDRSFAVRVLGFLAGVAIVLYGYNIWTIEIHEIDQDRNVCTEKSSYFVLAMSCIDSLLTSLVPMVMMLVMTSRLLLAITKDCDNATVNPLQTRRKTSLVQAIEWISNETRTFSNAYQLGQTNIFSARREIEQRTVRGRSKSLSAHRKLRKMLVAVSVVFLFLNLPMHVNKLQSQLMSIIEDGYVTSEKAQAITHLLDLLFYINFSVNFFVYSGFTKQFRSHILAIPVYSFCELKLRRKPRKDPRKNLLMSSFPTEK